MGLSNCPECGKVYLENPAKLCPECYEKEEQAADKVAEYLRDHPKSHINEVHEATGVSHKVILRMIRKGRVMGEFDVHYPCETCGAPITEGRVCNGCSKNILEQLTTNMPKEPETRKEEPSKKNSGMFTTRY